MSLQQFLKKWFWDSMIYSQGYNIINTLVYSVIFITAVFVTYKYFLEKKLNKKEMQFNKNFIIALYGWILSASSLRVLRDLGIYKTYWFVTPGIFILMFIVSSIALLLSLFLQNKKKIEYHKTWGLLGYLFAFYNLLRLPLVNIWAFIIIFITMLIWILVLYSTKKLIPKFLTSWNLGTIYAHLFDATATFVGIGFFGFEELHVLPGFMINKLGPWIMFPLKLIIISLVLYYLDNYGNNENEKKYLKIIIILLGLSTGTRDSLLLLTS